MAKPVEENYLITIKGTMEQNGENDTVELMTRGNFVQRGNSYYIVYAETEATGYAGCTTTVRVSQDARLVSMTRFGKTSSQLIIEKGIRHLCHYETGYGSISLGVAADVIEHNLLPDGGELQFSYTLYDIITMAMSTLCFGLFMAAFVLTLIIQIQRFSKNLLGDEGYLMFTLPASVSQHITAKLVVAVLLDVLSVAAAILAVLALALDGTMWLDLPGDFFDMIVYVDWSDWLLLLEVLILCLAAGAVGMLHIYASIAVGHLARKHRTLAAFGAYFGFAVALNILFTGMLEIFVSSPWMAEIGRWFMELKGDTGGHLLMWLLILGIAVLGAGFFVLTRYLLKNHLNLE